MITLTFTLRCNYLSMAQIPVYRTQVFVCWIWCSSCDRSIVLRMILIKLVHVEECLVWVCKINELTLSILDYFDQGIHLRHCPGKLHPCKHCLHMRNLNLDLDYLNLDLDYFLTFRCKHSQHAWCRGHVNMVCNPWLETWDVAIIYTGETRIWATVQWATVDHMTYCPQQN